MHHQGPPEGEGDSLQDRSPWVLLDLAGQEKSGVVAWKAHQARALRVIYIQSGK